MDNKMGEVFFVGALSCRAVIHEGIFWRISIVKREHDLPL